MSAGNANGIGYNRSQIVTLMDNMVDKFKDLQDKVVSEYETLSSDLRREWVGEDEQDYENKFVSRVNQTVYSAGELVDYSLDAIVNTANAWIEFQTKNKLESSGGGAPANIDGLSLAKLEKPVIPNRGNCITFSKISGFNDNQNMGLTSASSCTVIKESINSFVQSIKTAVAEFSDLKADSAFIGDDNSKAVNDHLKTLQESVDLMSTCVKDLYNHVEALTNTQYGDESKAVSQGMSEYNSQLENATSDVGGKWTSNAGSNEWTSNAGSNVVG